MYLHIYSILTCFPIHQIGGAHQITVPGAQAVERQMETFGDARSSGKASGSMSITELSMKKRNRLSADHEEDMTKAPKVVNDNQNLGVAASHSVTSANNIDKNYSNYNQ